MLTQSHFQYRLGSPPLLFLALQRYYHPNFAYGIHTPRTPSHTRTLVPNIKWHGHSNNSYKHSNTFPNQLIGTLFGHRNGHIPFSTQEDPKDKPLLLVKMPIPTNNLVKEMELEFLQIALECKLTKFQGKPILEHV